MRKERLFFILSILIIAIIIITTVYVAFRYMDEEPIWNRDPVPIVTDAPDAGQNSPWREMVTANLPPGRYADTIILNNGGDTDAAD